MTPLAQRMRAYAKEHAGNERMIELADKLDKAVETANANWTDANMKIMVGATARARLHWCKVTGEPLIDAQTAEASAKFLSAMQASAFPRRQR